MTANARENGIVSKTADLLHGPSDPGSTWPHRQRSPPNPYTHPPNSTANPEGHTADLRTSAAAKSVGNMP